MFDRNFCRWFCPGGILLLLVELVLLVDAFDWGRDPYWREGVRKADDEVTLLELSRCSESRRY